MPCVDSPDKKHVLEQAKPAIDGFAVDPQPCPYPAHVEQLTGRSRHVVKQPGHGVEPADRRDIRHVPLGNGARIGPQPTHAPPRDAS